MKKLNQWMLVAILTSATMFSSCVDDADNPVPPVPEPVETAQQAQFWSKFDKWQTDSCTVGDDFYMHSTMPTTSRAVPFIWNLPSASQSGNKV